MPLCADDIFGRDKFCTSRYMFCGIFQVMGELIGIVVPIRPSLGGVLEGAPLGLVVVFLSQRVPCPGSEPGVFSGGFW